MTRFHPDDSKYWTRLDLDGEPWPRGRIAAHFRLENERAVLQAAERTRSTVEQGLRVFGHGPAERVSLRALLRMVPREDCGALLRQGVGEQGRVLGFEQSPEMFGVGQERVAREGSNPALLNFLPQKNTAL